MKWMLASLLAGVLTLHGCDTFAASGSAVRTMESERQIPEIVLQVIAGAVNDAAFKVREVLEAPGRGREIDWPLRDVSLRIDGQPRTGFWAWCGALYRVAGYATDRQHAGSIELAYRISARGYDIDTVSVYRDGFVSKSFSTGWVETVRIPLPKFLQRLLGVEEIIREVPIHVTIVIRATEAGGTTLLVGTGRGSADTSAFSCGVVRSVAERTARDQLSDGLAGALLAIEEEGVRFYAGGSGIAPVLDRLRAGIELGRRIGR